jgi:hypothetical protein
VAKNGKPVLGRRHFLGVLATGGAVLAVAEPGAVGAASGTEPRESREQKSKARYRVTDDVRAFYRVNRYPPRRA